MPPGLLVQLVEENHLVSSQNRGSRDYHKCRELSEGDIVPFPQLSFPLRVNEVIVAAEGRLGNRVSPNRAKPQAVWQFSVHILDTAKELALRTTKQPAWGIIVVSAAQGFGLGARGSGGRWRMRRVEADNPS